MAKKREGKQLGIEQFIDALLQSAVAERASDIHIEPLANRMRVRFRIDGALHEKLTRPLFELEYLITRLKVLASLDIVTHLVPQDGHFEAVIDLRDLEQMEMKKEKSKQKTEVSSGLLRRLSNLLEITKLEPSEEQEIPSESLRLSAKEKEQRILDVRISIFPTINGEAAALRLLNRAEMLISLKDLGLSPRVLPKVENMISKPYGMVLVTGPSGSGKTTTLYSILQEVKKIEKNIITLEDPVEFQLEDIRQSQIRPERGFTFAIGMRSILRQDPDIIMLGEIRDPETAEHAIRASMVGRLVFSTLHSNSTVGTVARLIDMNIERSLIAYTLSGVISQRLVRKICISCKENYTPSPEHLKHFGIEKIEQQFVRGKGCDACGGKGYYGRIGIFEILKFDNTLRSMIVGRESMRKLQEYIDTTDMKTLKQDALDKARAGITTLEEAAQSV